MLTPTGSPLGFVQPTTAKLKALQIPPGEWLHAHDSDVMPSASHRRQLATQSAYRNILAWYLRAAGLRPADIANHLSISPSRVNALALKTRKSFYRGSWNISFMTEEAKRLGLRADQLAAHVLLARRSEMRAAEGVLARCEHVNRAAVSASLRIGRQTYQDTLMALAGATCACRMCALQHDGIGPYWETVG